MNEKKGEDQSLGFPAIIPPKRVLDLPDLIRGSEKVEGVYTRARERFIRSGLLRREGDPLELNDAPFPSVEEFIERAERVDATDLEMLRDPQIVREIKGSIEPIVHGGRRLDAFQKDLTMPDQKPAYISYDNKIILSRIDERNGSDQKITGWVLGLGEGSLLPEALPGEDVNAELLERIRYYRAKFGGKNGKNQMDLLFYIGLIQDSLFQGTPIDDIWKASEAEVGGDRFTLLSRDYKDGDGADRDPYISKGEWFYPVNQVHLGDFNVNFPCKNGFFRPWVTVG